MTRLKAKKDIYIDGVMVLRGGFYTVDDNVARLHIRDGKAELAPRIKPGAGEGRRTKVAGGSRQK
jgi:hypothetical protein